MHLHWGHPVYTQRIKIRHVTFTYFSILLGGRATPRIANLFWFLHQDHQGPKLCGISDWKKREASPELTSKQLDSQVSVLAGLRFGSRNRSGCRAAQYEMGKALLPAQVTELCHVVTPAWAWSAPAEGREQSAHSSRAPKKPGISVNNYSCTQEIRDWLLHIISFMCQFSFFYASLLKLYLLRISYTVFQVGKISFFSMCSPSALERFRMDVYYHILKVWMWITSYCCKSSLGKSHKRGFDTLCKRNAMFG